LKNNQKSNPNIFDIIVKKGHYPNASFI